MLAVFFCCLLSAMPMFEMTPADVDAYLPALRSTHPEFGARVIEVAKRSLGTPYFNGPLGEGPGAKYDSDPLIDLTRVDCVTFVEQTIALAASSSYKQAFDLLQKIRYKNGVIDFAARNHFMEADWVVNNTFCRSVTEHLGVPTAKASRTLGRKKFFELNKAPELEAKAVDQPMDLVYVPCSEAAAASKALPSPAIVLLVGKVDWLFVLHCGLFIRDESGKGLFYNASSTEKKVVAAPFPEVFENTTRYLGFIAYTINDPLAPNP